MAPGNAVGVIGAGAYGTALACAAARAGRDVVLYVRGAENAAQMQATRTQSKTARRQASMRGSRSSHDLAAAARADIILIATPAQNLREAATALAPLLKPQTPVIACAKGIERGTHLFMTEVIAEAIPQAWPAILSGPNFADDVARGLPTAVTLAAKDETLASDLVQMLGSSTFRPYHTTDVRGVEIGGAAKNVLAIAAGIVVGRKLGASAQAALTTRGFSELARLGRACGARERNAGGAIRPRRFDPELLDGSVAQFRLRHRARPRRKTRTRKTRRRRIHRTGADRTGGIARRRHAGVESGRGDPERQGDDRRRDRRPADAAVQGGRVTIAFSSEVPLRFA